MKIHLKDSSKSQRDEFGYDVEPNSPPIPFASRFTSSPRESRYRRSPVNIDRQRQTLNSEYFFWSLQRQNVSTLIREMEHTERRFAGPAWRRRRDGAIHKAFTSI